jgi:ADP-heptose:LPS heptosyltransferase
MRRKTFRVITSGGLGDVLLSTPVYKALKGKYPNCRIIMFCHDHRKDIFRNNPYIDQIRGISFIENPVSYTLYYLKWARFQTFYFGNLIPSLFYDRNATEIIAEMFEIELTDKKLQLFLTNKEEEKARRFMSQYNEPVVMHITSRFSKNQEWKLENWETLVKSMPECTFIQLGNPDEKKLEGAVDLRGKTTMREAFALIKYAKSFAGVNSFFSHVTNAFGTPGVVLFGASNPHIWGHSNNINLYKPTRCAPCIDTLLWFNCPYEKRCMQNITVEEVKEALLKQLSCIPTEA